MSRAEFDLSQYCNTGVGREILDPAGLGNNGEAPYQRSAGVMSRNSETIDPWFQVCKEAACNCRSCASSSLQQAGSCLSDLNHEDVVPIISFPEPPHKCYEFPCPKCHYKAPRDLKSTTRALQFQLLRSVQLWTGTWCRGFKKMLSSTTRWQLSRSDLCSRVLVISPQDQFFGNCTGFVRQGSGYWTRE
jgi:hypothetical protein